MEMLGAIYPKGGKFYAKILFPKALKPVVYFRIDHERPFVISNLCLDFPTLRVVDVKDFQTEVDYRKIFGEPSEKFIPSIAASDQRIIRHHEETLK